MKEHIHTIPVLDALREPEGCPVCVMYRKLDQEALTFMLGPSYMEDDIRMETNKLGFCEKHIEGMYAAQNRLGLALMLHTFMQQMNKDMDSLAKGKIATARFGKVTDSPAMRIQAHLEKVEGSCYLCRKINGTFGHYLQTYMHLWSRNEEAQELIKAVPGYCLPHFMKLLEAADKDLDKKKLESLLSVIIPRQQAFMKQMEEDLEWFTLKFDYRYENEPWKNAQDAVPRAMAMLNGKKA